MRILQINSFNTKYTNNHLQRTQASRTSLCGKDVVSFGAMKKSQFKGFELSVVESFVLPIEKYPNKQYFNHWVDSKIQDIISADYPGRAKDTNDKRKHIINEWYDYLTSEDEVYSKSQILMILTSLTKKLGHKDEKLPPALNKIVLAETVHQLKKELQLNPRRQFDFNKIYLSNLRSFYLKNNEHSGKTMQWIIIPSQFKDPQNFDSNVNMLKTLSHRNWCTKNSSARPYLSQGDFHILLENGLPQLCLRLVGDSIKEIQGASNDNKIPLSSFDEFNRHIDVNKFSIKLQAMKTIKSAQDAKKALDKAKSVLKEPIDNLDYEKILNYFGINTVKNTKGEFILSSYKQPTYFTFKDLGIDENELFKNVIKIDGDADFSYSSLTDLGKLKSIIGSASFSNSRITDLGSLEYINENASFKDSEVCNLDKLKAVGNHAIFENSLVQSLGNLNEIGGNAVFSKSDVLDLGKLELVGGKADFSYSKIRHMKNLKTITGDAIFSACNIESLGKLSCIGGNAVFNYSSVGDLGDLSVITKNADFSCATVNDFSNLKYIQGDADFSCSNIKTLSNLTEIAGNVDFTRAKISDLGKLEKILGNADFSYSKIKSLGRLKQIQGDALFISSDVSDLSALSYIGGDANFTNSCVSSIGCLKEVGKNVYIKGSKFDLDDFLNIKCKNIIA